MRYAAILAVLLLMAGPVEAQSRLGDGGNSTSGSGGNQTVNGTSLPQTMYAGDIEVIVTDGTLYGFNQDATSRNYRLGAHFNVYLINWGGGNYTYRVLVDELPMELANGEKKATTDEPSKERFELDNLRRVKLAVEITRGNSSAPEVLEWDRIRLRSVRDLSNDADDDTIDDALRDTIRQFTDGEWTWYNIRAALVLLGAVAFAVFSGKQRGREKEENEEPELIAG